MDHTELWKRIPGANIDQEALLSPGNVKIHYKDRDIEYISAIHSDREVHIEIQYRDGNQICWDTTNINVTFSMMWGIPLSLDCRHIFVPHSKGGVRCLCVEDGSIKWKTKSKAHFKHIMVNPTGSICCASGEHNIVVLDNTTGEELLNKRISMDNQFTVLGKDKILVEATSTKWYVLNSETLETIEIIRKKDSNSLRGQEMWKRIFQDWE